MGIGEIMAGTPAIFLDRDGIIIRAIVCEGKPYPPSQLDEVELLPQAIDPLNKLASRGYLLVGITNQPDVARGTQSREMVETINNLVLSRLPIREIFVCYHDNDDHCDCRKPKPGLILEASRKFGIDLANSWMVGDRWKDVAAGQAAGIKTIFVNNHYSEEFQSKPADKSIEDLSLLADLILQG
jgi:D-glycero-D-manno-heptose 1,7-bisphosphate phosphatase